MDARGGTRTDASSRNGGQPQLCHEAASFPTPAVRDYRSPNRGAYSDRGGGAKGEQLPNFLAHRWPTPSAMIANDRETPGTFFARRARVRSALGNGNGMGVPLTVATVAWATPRATDGAKGAPRQAFGGGGTPLPAMAAGHWPTPRTLTGGPETAERKQQLGRTDSGGGDLQAAAASWSTPSVADVTGGRRTRSGKRSGERLNNALAPDLMSDLFSDPQDQPTWMGGWLSPNAHLACYRRYRAMTDLRLRSELRSLLLMAIRRRDPPKPGEVRRLRRGWTRQAPTAFVRPSFRRSLGAPFVEWLMAWPPGLTSCDCSATAWQTHVAAWRSELSRLTLPAAPPAQLSLFG